MKDAVPVVPPLVVTVRQAVSPAGISHRLPPRLEPIRRFGPEGVGTWKEIAVLLQPVTEKAASLPGSPQLIVLLSVAHECELSGVNHRCTKLELCEVPKFRPLIRIVLAIAPFPDSKLIDGGPELPICWQT